MPSDKANASADSGADRRREKPRRRHPNRHHRHLTLVVSRHLYEVSPPPTRYLYGCPPKGMRS
jgi:hypothetical protein